MGSLTKVTLGAILAVSLAHCGAQEAPALGALGEALVYPISYPFPETSYPNGWLNASQGNSPPNWRPARVGGADTIGIFTEDPSGGDTCSSATDCPQSQCLIPEGATTGTCRQRVKQRSPNQMYTYGSYRWRVFSRGFRPANAQTSLAAFLYRGDGPELDFECGEGTAVVRGQALVHLDGSAGPARADEMVCYLVSQTSPAVQHYLAVPKDTWLHLQLDLRPQVGDPGKYQATWSINNRLLQTVALSYGPSSTTPLNVIVPWGVYISVENLAFMGDVYPRIRNEAWFDGFTYLPPVGLRP